MELFGYFCLSAKRGVLEIDVVGLKSCMCVFEESGKVIGCQGGGGGG